MPDKPSLSFVLAVFPVTFVDITILEEHGATAFFGAVGGPLAPVEVAFFVGDVFFVAAVGAFGGLVIVHEVGGILPLLVGKLRRLRLQEVIGKVREHFVLIQ